MLSAIAVFAISAGILLAAQSGCIGATLAGTDGSYDTPDTGLSGHALVQAVTVWEGMSNLIVACQIADTFADMLFTGVLDAAYAVHAVLSLTAVDNITDDDISLVLDGASDITTFKSGGHTYAVVAAYVDYGVQILDITDPANITAAGNIADIGEETADLELRRARGITTFVSGGHTYAAVAAYSSDGVQILNITNPSKITAAGNIAGDNTNTDDLELNGARGITTFVSGGHTYAAVAAHLDDGVQILNITDPSNITTAGNITNTDTLELDGASGIATFKSGGHTYVAVAAYDDNGVQILDVTDPLHIIPAGNITKIGSNTDDLELNGAYGITTFVSDGHTYAAVAAHLDDGVQILNITDPLHITPAGSIDTNTLRLNGAQDITTFTSGDHTYVAVAAYDDSGVQILDVTDPYDITPAGNIADIGRTTDGLELHRAQGITTFTSGDHTYVAVAAYEDDGVQIIRIDITTPPTVQAGDDQTVGEGDTVTLSGSTTDLDVDSITYAWSQTAPASPLIAFANSSAPLTTFTAPAITGDTVFTIALTANDGTQSAEDTLEITVKETSTAFITTWTASNSDKGITLPLTGTYSVLWGDDIYSPDVSGSQSHTYDVAGDYTVTVLGEGLERINLVSDITNAKQLRSIEQWGGTEWTTMYEAFDGAANMVYRATDAPDLSGVTDMTYMFFNAASFDGDLSYWNVSGVTDMSGMFRDTTSFNGNLSAWDVSRVTDMDNVFHGATSFNGDLSSWNVSGVTDMDSMFFETRSFNGNLSAWDVSGVTGMFAMFHDAESFNGNLSAWDVSRVIDMTGMFHGATSFNGDISAWDVSMVTDMRTMFHEASRFNGNLSAWDVSRVTDMNTMFDSASRFNGNLSAWDVSGVTDMNAMFDSATSFNGNLSSWDVSKVTTMIYMFRGATSFNGDISSWDVSSVTSMAGMFNIAISFNQPLNDWNVSSVTAMFSMFDNAHAFDQNLGMWYIVLDDTEITSVPGNVGGISTQNQKLRDQIPVYGIGGGYDSDAFEISSSNLRMKILPHDRHDYTVNITSTGSFGTGNHRVYNVTVTGNLAPELETIADRSIDEGALLEFTAVAHDPSHDSVNVVNNTLTFSLVGTVPEGASMTPDGAFSWTPTERQDGTHDVTVQVADGNGGSASEDVTVTVSEVNVAPSLAQIDSKTVDELDTLTFTASATDDDFVGNVTNTLTYSLAGTPLTGASINTSNGTFSWTPSESQDGVHDVTVRATDGSGISGTEELTITVLEVNQAPTADAGTYDPHGEGITVTLDGSGSSDPDLVVGVPNTLSYSWVQVGTGQTVTLSDANTASPTFTSPTVFENLTLEFKLTVTDDNNGSATDTATVQITDDINELPDANAGLGGTFDEGGTTVTLDGSGSSDDNPGDTLAYEWSQTAGTPSVTLSGNTTATASFTTPVVLSNQDLTFTLKVTDSRGGSDTDDVVITVRDSTSDAPIANIAGGSSRDANENTPVTLDGSGSSDPNGSTLTYTWSQTAGTPVVSLSISNDTASFTTPVVKEDTPLTFTLVVSNGNEENSASVIITVVDNESDDPVAVATGLLEADEGTIVTLNGSGSSDPNGDTLTYSWEYLTGTPPLTLSGATTSTPDFVAPQVGQPTSLEFGLTVRDVDGNESDRATVTVLVRNSANEPPVAVATGPPTTDEGATVTLDGSGSSDPDGDTLAYSWEYLTGTPPLTLSGADTATLEFVAPHVKDATTLEFRLTVTDTHGAPSTADVSTTLLDSHPNLPVADSGQDQTVSEGATVTLDGSGSSDPNGDTLTYEWAQAGTPRVTLSRSDPVKAHLQGPAGPRQRRARVHPQGD